MRKDILKYFKEIKEMVPSYYYWKRWDLELVKFLVNQHRKEVDPKLYGDIQNFFDNEYE